MLKCLMPGQEPLVGRATELSSIGLALAGHGPQSAVLVGGPGVGKTRLASCWREAADRKGWVTAHITASEAAASIPFGAFAPLLSFAGRNRACLRYLQQAEAEVVARMEGRPLLLVVDDGHLLDGPSALLVHQLATRTDVFVVLTVLADAPAPDPVTLLWKDGTAERFDIQPLSRNAATELVHAVLGDAVDGRVLRDLWVAAQGNPLMLRELLLGAHSSGALSSDEGLWRLSKPLAASARVRDLVNSRFNALDPVARQALEVLAVAEVLSLAIAEAMVGEGAVEQLERAALVVIEVEAHRSTCRLSHPMYGQVVEAGMPSIRRRTVCRWLLEVAEADPGLDTSVVALTGWRLAAGRHVASDDLLEAANRARLASDLPEAERFALAAWEQSGGLRAGLILGQVLHELGEHRASESVLAGLQPSASTDEERVAVAQVRADNLVWGLSQMAKATAAMKSAETAVSSPSGRLQLRAAQIGFDVLCGSTGAALQALDDPLHPPSSALVAPAALAGAVALALAGRTAESLDMADRGCAARIALTDENAPPCPSAHLVARCFALSEAGDLVGAHRLAEGGYQTSVGGSVRGQAWFSMMLGRVALLQGQLRTADRWFVEGAACFRQIDLKGPVRWCLSGSLLAAATAGDPERSAAAVFAIERADSSPIRMMESELMRGQGWWAAAQGELSRARALIVEAAEVARTSGEFALEAAAWHDLARLGDAKGAAQALPALAERIDGELNAARVEYIEALATNDGDRLDCVSERFVRMGALLFAAEASADAVAAHVRRGRTRTGAASTQRACAIADRCEVVRPLTSACSGGHSELSMREREVTMMVARGMTTKEVAGRLSLSPRTVDNYLQHAYRKLGISRRQELSVGVGE